MTGLTRADEHAAHLLARGYTEVTEAAGLTAGQRVRHIGEQYPGALHRGTGTLERIFTRGTRKDIEVIVRRDKPKFGPADTPRLLGGLPHRPGRPDGK